MAAETTGAEVHEPKAGYNNDVSAVVHEHGKSIGEAADIYGDLQTAEEYGYVTRGYVVAPLCPRFSLLDVLILRLKSQVSSHSVHCPWWHDRNWSFPRYWQRIRKSWSAVSFARIHLHWCSCLRYDAMPG